MPPLSKKRGHHDLRILRFKRIASTSGVRTHRKNERFSFAADTPILIFELKILPELFRKALAFIRFDDYNYTVNL